MGLIRKPGVMGLNSRIRGSVERTKKRMKKNELFSGRKMPMPKRPIRVHITMPRM